MDEAREFQVRIHVEDGHDLWAEVVELPGCFAAGSTFDELRESLREAVQLYLAEEGQPPKTVTVNDAVPKRELVTETRGLRVCLAR